MSKELILIVNINDYCDEYNDIESDIILNSLNIKITIEYFDYNCHRIIDFKNKYNFIIEKFPTILFFIDKKYIIYDNTDKSLKKIIEWCLKNC